MFTLYIDDSGGVDHPTATMAGLVATENQWQSFEAEAWRHLEAHNLQYMTAKQLEPRSGQFKDWSRWETKTFAQIFFQIAAKHIQFAYSVSIDRAAHTAGRPMVPREGKPHLFAVKVLVDQFLKLHRSSSAMQTKEGNLSLIIEKGNYAQAIKDWWARYRLNDPDNLGSILFDSDKNLAALQAADFIAYYTRRHIDQATSQAIKEKEWSFFLDCTAPINDRLSALYVYDFGWV